MSLILDLYALKAYEIVYEFAIRGLDGRSASLDQNRKLLKDYIAAQNANRSFSLASNPYTRADDLEEIRTSLTDILSILSGKSDTLTNTELGRYSQRLAHVHFRILNLQEAKDQTEVEFSVDKARTLLLECEALLYDLTPSRTRTDAVNDSVQVVVDTLPAVNVAPLSVQTSLNSTVNVGAVIAKWNVKFSGGRVN